MNTDRPQTCEFAVGMRRASWCVYPAASCAGPKLRGKPACAIRSCFPGTRPGCVLLYLIAGRHGHQQRSSDQRPACLQLNPKCDWPLVTSVHLRLLLFTSRVCKHGVREHICTMHSSQTSPQDEDTYDTYIHHCTNAHMIHMIHTMS